MTLPYPTSDAVFMIAKREPMAPAFTAFAKIPDLGFRNPMATAGVDPPMTTANGRDQMAMTGGGHVGGGFIAANGPRISGFQVNRMAHSLIDDQDRDEGHEGKFPSPAYSLRQCLWAR